MTRTYRTNFGSSFFAQFMASPAGRIARIVAGGVLIYLGQAQIGGNVGWVMTVVALVPLLTGIFDVCVFSYLFGGPFKGAEIRALRRSSSVR